MSASQTPPGAKPPVGRSVGRCPICGAPAQHSVRPFCSARCADIDLGRWTSGTYVIAGGADDADEDGDDGIARKAGQSGPGTGRNDGADDEADEDR